MQPHIQWVTEDLSPGLGRLEREADNFCAEVKNFTLVWLWGVKLTTYLYLLSRLGISRLPSYA
jgi:hypothetical protein